MSDRIIVKRGDTISVVNENGPIKVVVGEQGPAGADGGDRWEIGNWDSDRPATGEEILSWMMTTTVTFLAGMSAGVAEARVASTGTAAYSIQKNDVEIGTITFSAGNVTGVFSLPSNTTFVPGDRLSVVAPNPRDATLSGVVMSLVGSR